MVERPGNRVEAWVMAPGPQPPPAQRRPRLGLLLLAGLALTGLVGCGPAPSACGDTASNAEHCGACGHSCWGGLCSAGQCQPVLLPGGAGRVMVADGDTVAYGDGAGLASARLRSILNTRGKTGSGLIPQAHDAVAAAVEDGQVYWAQKDGIFRVPANGTDASLVPLVDASHDPNFWAEAGRYPARPTIAVSGGQLFWATQNPTAGTSALKRCPVSACAAGTTTVYETTAISVVRLATDGAQLLFVLDQNSVPGVAGSGGRTLFSCTVADCAGTVHELQRSIPIYDSHGPSLAVHQGRALWASGTGAVTCLLPDCVPTKTFGTIFYIGGVAMDDEFAYAADTDHKTVLRCPVAGCDTPAIVYRDDMSITYRVAVVPGFLLVDVGSVAKIAL